MGDVKRPYTSIKRQQAARATRLAIINAAGELFATRGYGATSVDDVAERAGVARATVFTSVGGKPALMRAAHHFAVAGEDEPRPAREGPLAERLEGVTGGRAILGAYAATLADVFEAVGPIHEALVRATSEAEDLRAMLAEVDADRHRGASNIVVLIRDELRDGLTPQRAADILWVHNDPQLWQALHHTRGWTKAEFRAWLATTLCSHILDAAVPRRG